jgi:SpoVK/Ycf46/Vps4 family AAA+-type ATPase
MHPANLYLDRTLDPTETVRSDLTSTDLKIFDSNEHLDRLHRLLYPVFRVEYEYRDSDGLFSESTQTDIALVDGLWDENDAILSQYAEGTGVTRQVPFDRYDLGSDHAGFGQTILLEFQAPDGAAANVLPHRLEGVENRPDPDGYLATLREEFDLTEAFDEDSFEGINDVSRVYLPFWFAQVRSERTGNVALLTVRDRTDLGQRSTPHDWLADYVATDPTRLPEYGYNVRQTTDADESDGEDDETDDATTAEADADAANGPTPQPSGTQPVRTDDEVTEPEDVDLDAASLVEPNPGRGFSDVGGMAELKQTLEKTVIAPVEQPERFAEYGLDPVSGVLLYGPPGCGKTYTAGALAGELGYYFLEVTPADLTSQYMGKPAQNVADLFEIARANQPCVVFIDELDAMAGNRSDDMNTSEQQAVNQLLTALEDIEDEDIVVLGATNLVEDIDPAIRRSGRFDERIEIPPPDAEARQAILKVHLAERPTVEALAYEDAVEGTAGYAASDLERVADVTARKALDDGADIDTDHLLAAVEAVDSSIEDWTGEYRVGGRSVTQPDDVDLNAKSLVTPEPARTFADVGGMANLEDTLSRRVIEPLENPEAYAEYGIDVLTGLLLYGPPGCGKTYVTEALAGELGHYFLEVTPADLTSKWMGQPAQNVADLFEVARANQPCILFIDELDALAGSRSGGMNTSERQLVNQLLTELEQVADDDVVVVGATNLVDDIDAAIRRSGRFDERIEVPPPDADARRAILEVHLEDAPACEDIEWGTVTAETAGYAASDLELIAENAARRAFRDGDTVDTEDLVAAVSGTTSSLVGWDDQHRYEQSPETSSLTRSE